MALCLISIGLETVAPSRKRILSSAHLAGHRCKRTLRRESAGSRLELEGFGSVAMPLAVGARIGPYEILASLGAGGMGEVYRARDSRLDRAVAIKILTSARGIDPDDSNGSSAKRGPSRGSATRTSARSRRRPAGRRALPGDGAARRRDARRASRAGPMPLDRALLIGVADCRGARRRAQQGRHPSRSQAEQRDAHGERREAPRLRSRQAPGRRVRGRRAELRPRACS